MWKTYIAKIPEDAVSGRTDAWHGILIPSLCHLPATGWFPMVFILHSLSGVGYWYFLSSTWKKTEVGCQTTDVTNPGTKHCPKRLIQELVVLLMRPKIQFSTHQILKYSKWWLSAGKKLESMEVGLGLLPVTIMATAVVWRGADGVYWDHSHPSWESWEVPMAQVMTMMAVTYVDGSSKVVDRIGAEDAMTVVAHEM